MHLAPDPEPTAIAAPRRGANPLAGVVLIAIATPVAFGQASPAPRPPTFEPAPAAIGLAIASPAPAGFRFPDAERRRPGLEAAYVAPDRARLLWLMPGGPTPQAVTLLRAMRQAADYGLDARDYPADALEAALRQSGTLDSGLPAAEAARLRSETDVAMSLGVLHFLSDLHSGRVAPRSVGHDLDVPHAPLDASSVLGALASSRDVASVLSDFEPGFSHYELLKVALQRYRRLDPALQRLPPPGVRVLEPGANYAGAEALRRLLRALGDLPSPPTSDGGAVPEAGGLYDPALVAGVMAFQARHGIEADGRIGRATFEALTTPFARRVRQLELSLERFRWLPPRLDSPPIFVNIPQFRLFAFRTTRDIEDEILQMNVIVGREFQGTRTPVFAADMRYVVMRPYWDVPRSILVKELLPKFRNDPSWLLRNRFEMVAGQGDDSPVAAATQDNVDRLARGELRLRQLPGPENSLGRAKFMFPNRYNVYLHGTPAQGLFARARRAFSHGCIRVEDTTLLMQHVLRDQPEWTRERIEEAKAGDRPVRVNLKRPLRVYIVYATALAVEDGRVFFFEDLYGHDQRLIRALSERQPVQVLNRPVSR